MLGSECALVRFFRELLHVLPEVENRVRSSEGRERLARVLRLAGDVVTVDHVVDALGLDRASAAKVLARWAKQGWLKRLRRGLYSRIPVSAIAAERTLANPWFADKRNRSASATQRILKRSFQVSHLSLATYKNASC